MLQISVRSATIFCCASVEVSTCPTPLIFYSPLPLTSLFLPHTFPYTALPLLHTSLTPSSPTSLYPTPHIPHSIFTNLTSPYSTHPSLHLHQPSLHPTPHIPHSIFTTLTSPYSTHPPLHLHQPSLHPTPHFPLSCHTPKPTPKSLYSKPLKSPAPQRHTARAEALPIESYYPAGCCILVATERSRTRGSD